MIKKIKFGIIGTSAIVETFLSAAKEFPEFELKGIYSRDIKKAEAFGKKHGADLFFDKVDEMASSKEIDVVYIASPTSFHAEHTLQCLSHKKHVICEKPFASNCLEVESMIKSAKEKQVILMEAMKTTLTPNFLWVKENLKEIGTIRRYFGNLCRVSSRYPNYKKGIVENAFKPELSNGSLMDIGVYCIYPMIVLFGNSKSLKVQGLFLSSGVDGSGTIMTQYEEMEGVIHHSKIADSYGVSEIQGDLGSVIIENINNWNEVKIQLKNGKIIKPDFIQEKKVMHYEIKEMLSLIRLNKMESEINSYENSLNTMKVLDEARKQIGLRYPADQ